MEHAKVTVQAGSLTLSVEGREEFVRDILSMWGELSANPVAAQAPYNEGPVKQDPASAPGSSSANRTESFENVFDSVDGKLKIIAHMPGGNKADKTRNTALALLFAHLVNGTEQVPSEAIREACADQGCLDSGNFSKHLKGLAEKVIMNTKGGGGYDVKLTAPGRKAAKEFVEALNSQLGD